MTVSAGFRWRDEFVGIAGDNLDFFCHLCVLVFLNVQQFPQIMIFSELLFIVHCMHSWKYFKESPITYTFMYR